MPTASLAWSSVMMKMMLGASAGAFGTGSPAWRAAWAMAAGSDSPAAPAPMSCSARRRLNLVDIWLPPAVVGNHPSAGCNRLHDALQQCTQPGRGQPAASALDDVYRQAAARGFLVFVAHVAAGVAHGPDHLVQADLVLAVAAERHARGVDGLDRAHGVALDAGDLHQPADRIAGQAEVVLHADLGGVLDLHRGAAQGRGEAGGGHRTGHADLALAADLGAGDRGVFLVEDPDRGGGEQEIEHALFAGARAEAVVVV